MAHPTRDRSLSLLYSGGSFLEAPRWHEDRWWVSDFYRYEVLAIAQDGSAETVLVVPGQPSGLGWLPDGSLIVVSMTDHRLLRRHLDGSTAVHADLTSLCGGLLNDLVIDGFGRTYVGNFGYDPASGAPPVGANLILVDPDGTFRVAADDLMVPNGLVLTPDGGTLIVGESMGCRYTAFAVAGDGVLSDRRVWAQLTPGPARGAIERSARTFVPDGCTLDAEGYIWSADPIGRRYCRLAPGGAIVEEIPAPDGLAAIACMLGGEDGRTLLLCASPTSLESRVLNLAVLLTTRVETPHAGRP